MMASLRTQVRRWLNRHRIEEHPPVRLDFRRIYVWPTWWGIVFLGSLLVMLVGSINYTLGMGYGATFVLMGMGIGTIWFSFATLNGLQFSPLPSPPVFAGDLAKFSWQIINRSRQHRFAVLGWADPVHKTQTEIAKQGEALMTISIPASRRGWLINKQVTVSSTFPLGMVRAWGYLLATQRCLIYPRLETNSPPLRELRQEELGEYQGGGQSDFAGLRPYLYGDPLRHIAWKNYARGAPLLTKKFEGGSISEIWIDWQQTPVSLGTEGRLSRLASWVWEAHQQGVRFGLKLPGNEIAQGSGIEQAHTCLAALALHEERPAARS